MQPSLERMEKKIDIYIARGGNVAGIADVPSSTLDQLYLSAVHLYEKSNYIESLKKFKALCFFDHVNPKYFIGLGSCQKMLKLYSNAIDSFSYAARMDRSNPLPLVYMGDCYNHLDEFEKSQRSYKAAVVFSKELGIENKEFTKAERLLNQ